MQIAAENINRLSCAEHTFFLCIGKEVKGETQLLWRYKISKRFVNLGDKPLFIAVTVEMFLYQWYNNGI